MEKRKKGKGGGWQDDDRRSTTLTYSFLRVPSSDAIECPLLSPFPLSAACPQRGSEVLRRPLKTRAKPHTATALWWMITTRLSTTLTSTSRSTASTKVNRSQSRRCRIVDHQQNTSCVFHTVQGRACTRLFSCRPPRCRARPKKRMKCTKPGASTAFKVAWQTKLEGNERENEGSLTCRVHLRVCGTFFCPQI